MAFHHRKLMEEVFNSTLTRICNPFCNSTEEVEYPCPHSCLAVCYLRCTQNILSHLSPPPPPPPPPPYYPLSPPPSTKPPKFSLPFKISLAILATTFFLFCCHTIYRCYKARYISRRQQPDETHDEFLDEDHELVVDHPIWYIRTVGLQPSVISAITICNYKRGEGLVEGTECSVCLNEFQEDETLRLLPKCNHAFHIPCIDTWLRSHTNCPLCRAGIVANAAALPSVDQSIDNSSFVEETQLGISQNVRAVRRERDDDGCELRIGTDEVGDLRAENGIKGNDNSEVEEGNSGHHLEENEFQPMRRSVSMDSLSASMISAAMANVHSVQSDRNSDSQLVKTIELNRGVVPKRVDVDHTLLSLVGSSSIGRSLQKGPISIKRSFSYSGKVLLSRHGRSRSRSRNSVLPS